MKIFNITGPVLFSCLLLGGALYAEPAPLKNLKIGSGFDRGFGITGSVGDLNGFIENDGDFNDNVLALTLDYRFSGGEKTD